MTTLTNMSFLQKRRITYSQLHPRKPRRSSLSWQIETRTETAAVRRVWRVLYSKHRQWGSSEYCMNGWFLVAKGSVIPSRLVCQWPEKRSAPSSSRRSQCKCDVVAGGLTDDTWIYVDFFVAHLQIRSRPRCIHSQSKFIRWQMMHSDVEQGGVSKRSNWLFTYSILALFYFVWEERYTYFWD